MYVVVEGPTAGDLTAALLAQEGVAGAWAFTTDPELTSRRWTAGARRITVAWLDDAPLAVADRIAPLVAGRAGVEFAGPFETITPWQWDWFD